MTMAVMELLNKLQHIPNRAWAVAGILSMVQIVVQDAFFWMWVILALTNMVDWVAGRCAIRATNPAAFSRSRSREGLYSKALGLTVLALLRSMEAVLPLLLLPVIIPGTKGLLSSVIGIALFIDELDSIDRHRRSLGKGPIPMLSWAIERLRSATGAERRDKQGPGLQDGGPDKRGKLHE